MRCAPRPRLAKTQKARAAQKGELRRVRATVRVRVCLASLTPLSPRSQPRMMPRTCTCTCTCTHAHMHMHTCTCTAHICTCTYPHAHDATRVHLSRKNTETPLIHSIRDAHREERVPHDACAPCAFARLRASLPLGRAGDGRPMCSQSAAVHRRALLDML